jgi:hypothetical protein
MKIISILIPILILLSLCFGFYMFFLASLGGLAIWIMGAIRWKSVFWMAGESK